MRFRQFIVALGAQGTGKTTLTEFLVRRARARGQKVRILCPEGNFPGGLAEAFPSDVDAWLEERLSRGDVDLLVCDDFDRYVPKSLKAKSPWHKLFLTNRHVRQGRGVDVILSGRRPQSLPESTKSAIDYAYIFQTSRMDKHGRVELERIAGDEALPAEKFRFLCLSPKTVDGAAWRGRTLPNGTITADR